jgi:2-methylisocitrate lyase-like PEP mutase family enzyme
MSQPRTSFRALLKQYTPLVTPSAYDALTARLVEQAGFPAIAIGGSAMLAAQFGLPDVGLASLSEMVEGARSIMRGTTLPCGIDADDGYGDVKSVVRTVRAYSEIGIGSMIFEDQLITHKKPNDGHVVAVVEPEAMERKLKAALWARDNPEMIILARTDAYRSEGLDGALRRAERYLAAGADGIFVSSLATPEELERVGRTLRGAIQVAVVTERLLNVWPGPADLYAMGFGQVVYPQFLIARATVAVTDALDQIRRMADGSLPHAQVQSFARAGEDLQKSVGVAEWADVDVRFG